MPSRIKLTDEDIQNWKTSSLSECISLWNLETNNIVIRGLSLEESEQLKKQILDDAEKAEKWDNFKFQLEPDYISLKKLVHNLPNEFKMNDNQKNIFFNRILQFQDRALQLEQENKQLQKTGNALHFDIKLNLGMIERQEKIIQKVRELANTPSDFLAETGHSTIYNVEIVLEALKEILALGNRRTL